MLPSQLHPPYVSPCCCMTTAHAPGCVFSSTDCVALSCPSLSSPSHHAVLQELVHLPVAPLGDGTVPGLVLLIESHTGRVEASMKAWYTSLLQADLAGDPQQRADGTLATLGAGEFFSMLNSQVGRGQRGCGCDRLWYSSRVRLAEPQSAKTCDLLGTVARGCCILIMIPCHVDCSAGGDWHPGAAAGRRHPQLQGHPRLHRRPAGPAGAAARSGRGRQHIRGSSSRWRQLSCSRWS